MDRVRATGLWLAFCLPIMSGAAQTPSLTGTDIGELAISGSTRIAGNGWDLIAAGNNNDLRRDQYHFAWQDVSGDFDFRVRVAQLDHVDLWTRAGLMVREDLGPSSRFASVFATPTLAGCFFLHRLRAGGGRTFAGSFPVNPPQTWLRLEREGDVFRAYAGIDGRSWRQLGETSLVLPVTIPVGLALSSEDTNRTATAEFRDFGPVESPTAGDAPLGFEPLGPSSRRTALVISEIHYHPSPRADGLDLEFIELFNSQPIVEDLSGYTVTGDIQFTFPSGTTLKGGGFLVLARDANQLRGVYPAVNVLGPYVGSLSAESGRVALLHRNGALLLEVSYSSAPPWPAAADGAGHSLVLSRPSYGENSQAAWTASAYKGGSPGALDPAVIHPLNDLVINEFLAHTDEPAADFIELYNHSNRSVDLSLSFLSDSPNTNKFRFPEGTSLPPGGFVVLDQYQLGFSLSATGETIYFTSPDNDRVIDAVRFGAQANGVATGRSPDGSPEFHPLAEPTPGAANAPPLFHDVVINELMFDPVSGDDDDEYVELFNRGSQAVDLSHWRFIEGIDFTFPAGTVLEAGSYLIVARSRDRLLIRYPQLNTVKTLGDYSGRLSNSGERLVLARPEDGVLPDQDFVVVDEVNYADGGRWGRWANRGGSSLELIDPHSDNRRAANWADSDESNKSDWITVEHTGVLDLGRNAASELHVLLLGSGECLVDDIEVSQAGGPNLISNPTFDSGFSEWTAQGNHVTSGRAISPLDPASLHLRASGGGDNGANRIKTVLLSAPAEGSTVTIRAKARWLAGHTNLLLRLKGNWLEAVGTLPLPEALGSPGQPNTRLVQNAGPALFDVRHHPVLPAAGQPVRVTARAYDPDGLRQLTLHYRLDPGADVVTLPMIDDGTQGDAVPHDGLYTAVIPGQSAGVGLAFHLRGLDELGVETRFPDDAPVREPMIRFGETVPFGAFGTYRFWLTQSTVDTWTQREQLSNQSLDTTFVYGQYRAIYNAGARYRGSPFIRPNYTGPTGSLCAYVFEVPRDDTLLGSREFNLDWLEQPGRDDTFQRERTSFWIAEQLGLPFSHQAYIQLYVNGLRRGIVYTDSQQPNSDYIAAWFPQRHDGELFKIDDWFEFNSAVQREFNVDATLQDFTTTGGVKKQARYRWNWEKKSNGGLDDDYTRLFDLADAVNTSNSANYTAAVESIVDVEQWMRIFALRHIVSDWDGYGYRRGKNQSTYKPTGERWQMLLWDLDFSLGGGSDLPTHDLYQTGDPTIARMYNHPPFHRAYLRALHDAAQGPLQPEAMDPVLDATFAALRASQLSVVSPTAVKTWVAQRRAYILNHLAQFTAPLAITSNGGEDFATDNPLLLLEGTAPVGARTLRVNGVAYPVAWITPTSWQLRLPLGPGTQALTIEGFDSHDQPIADASPTITVTYTGPTVLPDDHLVINEIMYAPAVPDSEFIEIHNTSPTHAFDLSRHRLVGVDFDFPDGSIIEPGGFLVLAANRSAFAAAYGSDISVLGEFVGRLQPEGERLRLIRLGDLTRPEQTLTEVTFSNQAPWPAANARGASLQLVDPTQANDRVGNWAARTNTPPVPPPATLVELTRAWRYNQSGADLGSGWRAPLYPDGSWPAGPALLYVEESALPAPKNTALTLGKTNYYFRTIFDYSAPVAAQPMLKLTTVIDDGAVLYLNGEEIFRLGMPPGTISAYTFAGRTVANAVLEGPFEIPSDALRPGQNVLAAEVHQVNSISSDIVFGAQLDVDFLDYGAATPGAPNSVRADLPPFPSLWINEVQAYNTTGLRDSAGETDPWVELYNAGSTNIPLVDVHLSDDYSELTQWSFPLDAVIAPGQHLIVWLDAQPHQSSAVQYHANFRIGPGAGSLALSRTSGGKSIVLDYLNFEALPADISYGRLPDGSLDAWRYLLQPSPGETNRAGQDLGLLRINEWMAGNTRTIADALDGQFSDWFEIYNAGDFQVDLTGCTLTDEPTQPGLCVIPPGYSIPPRGFLLVWADDQSFQNGLNPQLHVNFKLDKAGEFIGLHGPSGMLLDQVFFGPQTDDISQGRYPDGTGQIVAFLQPTPAAPNRCPPIPPVIDAAASHVRPDGSASLTWSSQTGCRYLIQYKNLLEDPQWYDLGPPVISSGPTTTIIDFTTSSQNLRFYRIQLRP